MVVSSLVFHYIKNLKPIFENISRWLRPSGQLIFSVEHPICTANPDALTTMVEGEESWLVKNYRDEEAFRQKWFVEGVLKYHHMLSSYVNLLIDNNLRINKMLEPMPSDKMISENSQFRIHKVRPPLLMISTSKY